MIKYCKSIFKTERRQTREVLVGNIGIGGTNPIRIQSMTTSNTRDVEATVEQIKHLADAGCDIARITVQGMKEAESCEAIKNSLISQGYTIPLVADIHFFPPAAMRVIDFVEKVRVNPGNFVDKRASFKTIDYDDASYAREIEKIAEKFTPLVEKCKRLKKSMRIGTNHGSLSDRIMNRFGDTPRGMLESALEFARICRQNDFHDFIFSMKSSNPQVMIQAYRLLSAEMLNLGWDYPLHLGVTEAGEGEDGRIKSAMGIGTLLLDGLGDTIRVSLTEDAWHEIDPCKRLVSFAESQEGTGTTPFEESHRNIEAISRRKIILPNNIALHRDGTVMLKADAENILSPAFYKSLGCEGKLGQPKLKTTSADCIFVDHLPQRHLTAPILQKLKESGIGVLSQKAESDETPLLSLKEALDKYSGKVSKENFSVTFSKSSNISVLVQDETPEYWSSLNDIKPALIVLAPKKNYLHYCRQFFDFMQTSNNPTPVILKFSYSCSKEDLIIRASAEFGALFCDGLGDGLWIDAPYEIDFLRGLSFSILQAARMRTSKTDFISCPSCGRTLFDLQDVSKRIRSRTAHLPGVKIAIMGCIVNGPGEMADADFGYVGSRPGMIDLYIGKECVEKNISFADADDRLIDLIKKEGRWLEPEEQQALPK